MMIGRAKLPVWRDHINMARFHRRQARNLGHRHFRPRGENIGKLALALRIEMHHNNERCVDVGRKTFEKHLQRVDAAGGRSNAHGREAFPCRLPARSPFVFRKTGPLFIIAHLGTERLARDARSWLHPSVARPNSLGHRGCKRLIRTDSHSVDVPWARRSGAARTD
jgi:hypothetical protein